MIKPLVSGAVMGAMAILVYKFSSMLLGTNFIGNLISSVISIAAAAIIYFALVFGLHIFSDDEVKQLPAGNKIYSLLCKIKFYK